MLYVGLDVHVKHITICVLDNNGKVFQRCEVRQIDQLLDELECLPGRIAAQRTAHAGRASVTGARRSTCGTSKRRIDIGAALCSSKQRKGSAEPCPTRALDTLKRVHHAVNVARGEGLAPRDN